MNPATDPDASDTPPEPSKPPFLRRVRIRGYKSIAFCDVSLEPLTILVGRNASGKSNFLDALAFLRDVIDDGLSTAAQRRGGGELIPCRVHDNRAVSIEIESEIEIAGDPEPGVSHYRIDLDFPVKKRAVIRYEALRIQQGSWWVGYTNAKGRVTCRASDDTDQQRRWDIKDRPFLDAYFDTPVPEFAGALTALTSYNFRADTIRELAAPSPDLFLESDGRNIASVITAIRETEPATFDRIGRYLAAITKNVELVGVARYGFYETVRFRVLTQAQRGPLEFDAASMSDGTLRVLAALVAAYQVIPPYGYPSLVAIEEPETALHPAAMRALVDALDEATLRTQILLTTHSAEMLDNPTIRPENVRVVQMIDGQTVIAPVDEASVQIVRQKLNTLGGLERDNLLEPDPEDIERQEQVGKSTDGPPA